MFQKTIASEMGHGIPGELAFDGPLRGQPVQLAATSAANNIIGSVALFFLADQSAASEGTALAAPDAAGTGAFAGFLVAPKSYAWRGSVIGNAQTGSMTLPNGTIAEACDEGTFFMKLTTTGDIGDNVYANATGQLIAVAPGTDAPLGSRPTGATVARFPVLEAGLAVLHVGQSVGVQGVAAA